MTARNVDYQAYGVPIGEVLDCMSGNSGLTEELIYQHSGDRGKRYRVLSSSTSEETEMGYIVQCSYIDSGGKQRELKVFEGKAGLLVARNGIAGSTRFLPPGDYTINDHAYILSVKDDCPYEIDLRWLSVAYRSEFLAYSSNSANGTWNKTGFFNNVQIDIAPVDKQERVAELMGKYEHLSRELSALQRRLDQEVKKQLVERT